MAANKDKPLRDKCDLYVVFLAAARNRKPHEPVVAGFLVRNSKIPPNVFLPNISNLKPHGSGRGLTLESVPTSQVAALKIKAIENEICTHGAGCRQIVIHTNEQTVFNHFNQGSHSNISAQLEDVADSLQMGRAEWHARRQFRLRPSESFHAYNTPSHW